MIKMLDFRAADSVNPSVVWLQGTWISSALSVTFLSADSVNYRQAWEVAGAASGEDEEYLLKMSQYFSL